MTPKKEPTIMGNNPLEMPQNPVKTKKELPRKYQCPNCKQWGVMDVGGNFFCGICGTFVEE